MILKQLFIAFGCLLLVSSLLNAQNFSHEDFIGAGHDKLITVTTSSNSTAATGQQTVDGFDIQEPEQLKDASRFLAQCTFGADWSTIEMVAAMGKAAWLQEQFALPQAYTHAEMYKHSEQYLELDEGEELGVNPNVWSFFFRTSWLDNNLQSPDLLRQRMAFIWSQIMVINTNSDLFEDWGQISANYYDMLATDVYSNYETLLMDVTLSPAMGMFLSHFGNPKANPALNIHPDENYAREIMQLFSIGLWELNPDGTRAYDADGNFIPTYNNNDIKEFAQVFTGLADGTEEGYFGHFEETESFSTMILTPMKMYQNYHDTSSKVLLNGVVLPANQPGMVDVEQTIQHLANHQNAAPFICKSLIKMMTTSNPSPTYVSDVVAVFNPSETNNFQAVISAILLHPEARTCTPTDTYTFGKLREPLVRTMNFLKAFQMSPNTNGDFYSDNECYRLLTGQSPLEAPSVFNFYLPHYSPQGPIGQNYLVGPEFQILNTTNAIGGINDMTFRTINRGYLGYYCIEEEEPFWEWDLEEDGVPYVMDYSTVLPLTDDSDALIDYLDILLANGLLTPNTKLIIKQALEELEEPNEKLKMAIYLIYVSPDYNILK